MYRGQTKQYMWADKENFIYFKSYSTVHLVTILLLFNKVIDFVNEWSGGGMERWWMQGRDDSLIKRLGG